MKNSKDSALDSLETMISRIRPGTEVTYREIVEMIKPQYRDAQTIRTAVMLVKKYDITLKKGD